MKKEKRSSLNQWHPAFLCAIQKDLEQWKHALHFEPEHQLNLSPLVIDLVIIKKKQDIVIDNPIAAIFKGHNIIEYKSPLSYVSIDDFKKVYGYAYLYASLCKTDLTDISVSFVEDHYPRKLFEYFKNKCSYKIEEKWSGIYHITGGIITLQFIDRKRLSDGNRWLKGLGNDLNVEGAAWLMQKALETNEPEIDTYVKAVLTANWQIVEEITMRSEKRFEQALEKCGLIQKWEARGEAKGIAMGEAKGMAVGEARGMAVGEARGEAERERLIRENEQLKMEISRLKKAK
jgi:hypothetical protein